MKTQDTATGRKMLEYRFLAGSWSAFAVIIAITIAVLANLIAGNFPVQVTQIDLTSNSIYTLSDQTRQIMAPLDKDVRLILLASTGNEDSSVIRFLNAYTSLSDHIKVETVDPASNPAFLKSYELDMSKLYQNSVIVQCADRYRLVSYNEIYVKNYTMNYQTQGYDTTTAFHGENAVTNAIHFVTSQQLPKVYLLQGHGEQELSKDINELIRKDNMELQTISLLTQESIPSDASAVLINAPSADLSDDEAEMLMNYLKNGGNVFLITDYIAEGKMSNLLRVTQSMGLTVQQGIIIEGDQNMRVSRYPHYLLPEIADHETTKGLKANGYHVITPIAQPIVQTDSGGTAVTWLLSTSASAYAKQAALEMKDTKKEPGDTDGPFHVGAVSAGQGKLIWFSSGGMLLDQIDRAVAGGNSNLLLNLMNWSSNHEERISIRAKSMNEERLTVPEAASHLWSAVMIGLLPVALICVGTAIRERRKRR